LYFRHWDLTRFGLKVPFLYDAEAHARFLIALSALIIAEVTVHLRLSPVIRQFIDRQIVTEKDLPAFKKAVGSTLRLRNSTAVEVILAIVVFGLGSFIWQRGHTGDGAATWYGQSNNISQNLTMAGYWYAYVSTPIFQFILLRWYMRIAIWLRLYGGYRDRICASPPLIRIEPADSASRKRHSCLWSTSALPRAPYFGTDCNPRAVSGASRSHSKTTPSY
jgi:hypothetical protein